MDARTDLEILWEAQRRAAPKPAAAAQTTQYAVEVRSRDGHVARWICNSLEAAEKVAACYRRSTP